MADFALSQHKHKQLLQKMARLGIREQDLIEKFVRSGGPGGQNVNKTSTLVYLKHIPTGIEVRCQRERSQALNRFLARVILVKKIENFCLQKLSQQRQRIEKMHRQMRKKPKSLKLRILEEKRKHAKKKLLRAKLRQIDKEFY